LSAITVGCWSLTTRSVRRTSLSCCPRVMGGHVVITSRAHADWRSLGAQPLGLDVWERQEALEFLFVRSGQRDRVVAVADAVAQALGDLPLALEQAAAYTNKQVIGLVATCSACRIVEFPRFDGHLTAGPSSLAWRMSVDAQDPAVFAGVQA
jgi:hypothetical protein